MSFSEQLIITVANAMASFSIPFSHPQNVKASLCKLTSISQKAICQQLFQQGEKAKNKL